MKLDLNCDLGEGEPASRTRALMKCITSANVACGGHAGDLATMERCVRLAKEFSVRLGAHPGPWGRHDFGRTAVKLTPNELELLLLQQVGALEHIAQSFGVRLHHIKLHGALFHASERDEALARRYLQVVRCQWPGVKVYALAGGRVASLGSKLGVTVWEEVYLDRGYRADGKLVPRVEKGALIGSVGEAVRRLKHFLARREITTLTGATLKLNARTLCVHSDSPNAVKLASMVARILTPD
jgi:UPF0271 protein